MNIIQVNPKDLNPYKLNAKLHSQPQIEGIAESIRRFGFTQPVIIDKENEIIIGHGRVEAAKLLKLEAIPAVQRKDLNELEIKALRLIDNRIAESPWDPEMLKLEMENIEYDFDNFNVSFDEFNLETVEQIDYEKEWEGMPEFDQPNTESFRHVIVHFKSNEDCNEFFKKIGQNCTEKTKSTWYPEQENNELEDKRYE